MSVKPYRNITYFDPVGHVDVIRPWVFVRVRSGVRCPKKMRSRQIRVTARARRKQRRFLVPVLGVISRCISQREEFELTLNASEPHLVLICRRGGGERGRNEAVAVKALEPRAFPHWNQWYVEWVKWIPIVVQAFIRAREPE